MKFRKPLTAIALSSLVISLAACSGSGGKDTVELMPVKTTKTGNWSMLSSDGTIVYDSEFKNKPTPCFNGVFTVENSNGGYTLYRADSKTPQEVPGCDSLICAGLMFEDLMPVTFADSRITLINKKGEKKVDLTPKDGMEIVSSMPCFRSGLLGVKLENDKWGFVNKSGELVIKAKYDMILSFQDEYGLVGTEDEKGNTHFEVINPKGETIFKIKDKYKLSSFFNKGHIVVKDEGNRYSILDDKGEATKLPDKVDEISGFNGKYIIFKNDDNQKGVVNLEGEIIVRPKYRNLEFCTEETFWAQKDRDSEFIKLDKKGETVLTLDYKEITEEIPGFGFFAKDGGTYILMDSEGKMQGKEEFYSFSTDFASFDLVKTDYFDFTSTSNRVADMLTDNGVCGLTFGQTPGQIFKDETASYTSSYNKMLEDKKSDGYFANIIPNAGFNKIPTRWGGSGYEWNPEAQFTYAIIEINARRNISKDNFDTMVKAIEAKGFKIIKSGQGNDSSFHITLMEKGKEGVLVQYKDNSSHMQVLPFSVALDPEAMPTLKAQITSDNASEDSSSAETATADESETEVTEEVAATAGSDSDFRALVTGKKLTPQDLAPYSKAQLRLMRNTVYAIHGRKFTSKDLQQYFSQFSWYKPTVTEVPLTALSEIEKHNVTLIQKYE